MLNKLQVIYEKLSSNNPTVDFSELLTLIENDQKLVDTLPNIITYPIDDISSLYGVVSQLHNIINDFMGEYPATELLEIKYNIVSATENLETIFSQISEYISITKHILTNYE